MTIFDKFETYIGDSSISPLSFEECDLNHFGWWKSKKVITQCIIKRKSFKDFYAAFKLYDNIENLGK